MSNQIDVENLPYLAYIYNVLVDNLYYLISEWSAVR